MKTAIFTPYGTRSEESGIIYLLANYMRERTGEVYQLRCNGAFPVCDRDEEREWRRDIDSCALCSHEQLRLAQWAGVETRNMTKYLLPADIDRVRTWATRLSTDCIASAELDGHPIHDYCKASIERRTSSCRDDERSEISKRYLFSAGLTLAAVPRWYGELAPDLILAADGEGYMSRSFNAALEAEGAAEKVVRFRWMPSEHTIRITVSRSNESAECPLLLEDVSVMRSNHKTWPREILQLLDDVLELIGATGPELSLPIAR